MRTVKTSSGLPGAEASMEGPSAEGAAAWSAMVRVGRVGRPHGLRGDVAVSPDSDFVDERFARGSVVWTEIEGTRERLEVASAGFVGRRLVVGFRGITTVEAADRLAGCELRVAEDALKPLAPGHYYLHQLVGCRVETVRGDAVGHVVRVEGGTGASVLVVEGSRGEVLVPLAERLCPTIDVTERVIRVDPPDGLLEVNVPTGRRSARVRAMGGRR
jgi:16S rRNA processing protein RimM